MDVLDAEDKTLLKMPRLFLVNYVPFLTQISKPLQENNSHMPINSKVHFFSMMKNLTIPKMKNVLNHMKLVSGKKKIVSHGNCIVALDPICNQKQAATLQTFSPKSLICLLYTSPSPRDS